MSEAEKAECALSCEPKVACARVRTRRPLGMTTNAQSEIFYSLSPVYVCLFVSFSVAVARSAHFASALDTHSKVSWIERHGIKDSPVTEVNFSGHFAARAARLALNAGMSGANGIAVPPSLL